MRTPVLLLTSMALAVLLACGVAFAVDKNCPRTGGYCVGTEEPDNLSGSERRDIMEGLWGDDTLLGNEGNDDVTGYNGDDTLSGGAGNDDFATEFSDNLHEGSDTIKGGGGYDYVYDLIGENKIYGQRGDDTIYGYGLLNGGQGNDHITAYNGDYFSGEGQTETIIGGPGKDQIKSPDYNLTSDTIYADDGERDTISCGGGDDTVYYDRRIDSVNTADCENLIRK